MDGQRSKIVPQLDNLRNKGMVISRLVTELTGISVHHNTPFRPDYTTVKGNRQPEGEHHGEIRTEGPAGKRLA